MRHATVLAVNAIFQWIEKGEEPNARLVRACSWESETEDTEHYFGDQDGEDLARGLMPVVGLPTCPACAALVDLALEMRGGL